MSELNTLDSAEYPARWSGYIGQEQAVKMLRVGAASARIRKQPLDHVLIAHPFPGIGKTALASLVARELRRPARVVSGALSMDGARLLLSTMRDRDVLVYDEFHRITEGGKGSSEWLLHLLQDNTLIGPFGPEPQPRITLIAATTHAHRVPPAVLDRFMLVPSLTDYNTDEAARIAQVMGKRVLGPGLPSLTKVEATAIATAAGRNPRAIKRLLVSLRDLSVTGAVKLRNGHYDVAALLDWNDVTPDGLSPVARRYLTALRQDFSGAAGIKALEERLGHPGGLADVERTLIDSGLVGRTRTGRKLTQAGFARTNAWAN